MGMENLLNYYFIMKKRFVTVLLACSLAGGLFAQQPWFKDKDLTLTGAYYYPEHWDESQWERDFKQMHDLGFEFTHFAEFAWAQLEPEEGKYDFAWLDKAVALAAKYDLKVIMCTSTATPPVWLSRKYPEILIKNEKYLHDFWHYSGMCSKWHYKTIFVKVKFKKSLFHFLIFQILLN